MAGQARTNKLGTLVQMHSENQRTDVWCECEYHKSAIIAEILPFYCPFDQTV